MDRRNKILIHKAGGFMVIAAFAAFFWLVIQLSENYTETLTFSVEFDNVPAEKILPNNIEIKTLVSEKGYKFLRYYLVSNASKKIVINLDDNNHYIIDNQYIISNNVLQEAVAAFLQTTPNNITLMNEDVVIPIKNLARRRVPVIPDITILTQKQFRTYGQILIRPDSIDIYGEEDIIDSIVYISTKPNKFTGVNRDFKTIIPLDFQNLDIHSDVKEILIDVDVERFTEYSVDVPIICKNPKMKLLPEKVNIRYLVALKDFNTIDASSFLVELDFSQKLGEKIDLKLSYIPNNVHIINITPKEVEYMFVE